MLMKNSSLVLAIAASVALALSGCGGSGGTRPIAGWRFDDAERWLNHSGCI